MTTSNPTPTFDAARSAAIRELLIQTVDAAPSRRPTRRFAMVAALSGVALALAGGTAALALTGVLHFGEPAPAPAPVVPSSTATPSPTPTSTPAPTETPIVTSGPILPHDVDALPAQPRWTLDLPGADDGCTLTQSYTLSDGRALYATGLRPKEYEGSDCINETHEDIALTLVDTSNGTKLWSREWAFHVEHLNALSTTVSILGTSGRAVISYGLPEIGPHEVIDLRTGAMVAPFQPGIPGLRASDMVALPDGSGDMLIVRHNTDAQGQTVADDILTRVDPRDPSHPEWSTSLSGGDSSLDPRPLVSGLVAFTGWAADTSKSTGGLVDVATGQLVPMDQPWRLRYFMRDVVIKDLSTDNTTALSGYDSQGRSLWNRTFASPSQVVEVTMPGALPGPVYDSGNAPGTGWFTVVTATEVALVDEMTGQDVWRTPRTACASGAPLLWGEAQLDTTRGAIVIPFTSGATCSYAVETGALIGTADLPDLANARIIMGDRQLYTYLDYPYDGDPGPGSAYDLVTGRRLWTLPRSSEQDYWEFVGGYLVSRRGSHLTSIG